MLDGDLEGPHSLMLASSCEPVAVERDLLIIDSDEFGDMYFEAKRMDVGGDSIAEWTADGYVLMLASVNTEATLGCCRID